MVNGVSSEEIVVVFNEPWYNEYNQKDKKHHKRKSDERSWFKPVDRKKENEYL